MTILEALQSMVEYKNDDLLAKALTDNGLTAAATYTAANERAVDLAAADVYFALCSHPKFREGSKYIDYAVGTLMSLRREIHRRYGLLKDTVSVPQDSRYNKVW